MSTLARQGLREASRTLRRRSAPPGTLLSGTARARGAAALGAVVAATLICAGCAAAPTARVSSTRAAAAATPLTKVGAAAARPGTEPVVVSPAVSTTVTKVLVFIEENHSLAEMKAGMPYLYSQATKYGYASHYTAISHPSLPNYLAIAGGSTFGVTDDAKPSSHVIHGPSVFGAALKMHKTAKSYQESMSGNCRGSLSGRYAPKHNPWAYFVDERSSCLRYDVPAGTTSSGALRTDLATGTLPVVGEVTPNLDHDAHDGTLAAADSWLKGWLTKVYAGPDWRSGHLAVVVSADEDDRHGGNTVMTAVLHPSLSHRVVTTTLTHYSLTRFLAVLTGAPCLHGGCTAHSLRAAFGLT